MESKTVNSASRRKMELTHQYLQELDKHIDALRAGTAEEALEIREFAEILHVHPVHLSNTIKEVTGKSTCDLFEERLVKLSKEMLLNTNLTISQIATQLTYDPSNFTKFFKQYTGITPKVFRNNHSSGPKS